MGDMIESALRPFLQLRRKILEVGGILPVSRTVESSLGQILRDLEEVDNHIYALPPLNISISQWRNISHHSAYSVTDDVIRCEIGQSSRKRTIECSPKQLIQVFVETEKIYYVHKVAFEFFATENIRSLSLAEQETGTEVLLSDFSKRSMVAYGLVASGFHVLHAGYKDGRWAFVLIDNHNRSARNGRAALQGCLSTYLLHVKATQFNVWVRTRQKEYFLSFRGELRGDTRLASDEYVPYTLDRNMRILDSKT